MSLATATRIQGDEKVTGPPDDALDFAITTLALDGWTATSSPYRGWLDCTRGADSMAVRVAVTDENGAVATTWEELRLPVTARRRIALLALSRLREGGGLTYQVEWCAYPWKPENGVLTWKPPAEGLRIPVLDSRGHYSTATVVTEGSAWSNGCVVRVDDGHRTYVGKGSTPFEALVDVRRQLEPERFLRCFGTSLDVHSGGMAAESDKAYRFRADAGMNPSLNDLRMLYDGDPNWIQATVEQQEARYAQIQRLHDDHSDAQTRLHLACMQRSPQSRALTCLSRNLGCGGPHSGATRVAAQNWVESVLQAPVDILFLQEGPDTVADLLGGEYHVAEAPPTVPQYRCRSLVAVRRELDLEVEQTVVPTALYHGTYLAACRVTLPDLGRTTLVSVHASPTPVTTEERQAWPGELPAARPSALGGQLWDADMVLATLGLMAPQGPVLAAGDLNEARTWDKIHTGHWGDEFFGRATELGLVDPLHRLWGVERPTRGGYQIDHVLASPDVADAVAAARVMERPDGPAMLDHLAVWFGLVVG